MGKVRSAIFGVASVIFVSKALGFLREIVIANKFGTTADYDLYLIAIMLPALFYGIINYAGFYFLVPYFSKKELEREGESSESPWAVVNLNLLFSLIVVALTILMAPIAMKLWASGLNIGQFETIVFYSRVTSAIIFLGATEATMRAILNSRDIAVFPAFGFAIFNIVSIVSILSFYDSFGVGAIAIGLVGGLFVQNLFLFIRTLQIKSLPEFSIEMLNEKSKLIISAASLLLIIELFNKAYFLIDRYFAVSLGEGVISALNYSHVLIQLPEAVIGFAIGAVVFPLFSKSSVEDKTRFAQLYKKTVTIAIFVSAPLAIFFYLGAPEIIQLAFMRGSFDFDSVEKTVALLRPFAPSIVALFILATSIRACYSNNWTKQVLVMTLLLFAVKLISTYFFVNRFGFPGLSAGSSFSQVLMAMILMIFIVQKLPKDSVTGILSIIVRNLMAIWSTFFAVKLLYGLVPVCNCASVAFENFRLMAILAMMILLVYIAFSYLFGLKEQLNTFALRKHQ